MSDTVVDKRGSEYLSSWVGEEVVAKLPDILPEEIGFVIERVYPQKAGFVGVQGTFKEWEIGEEGPEEFIERFFGGGRYTIRARKKGQYIKGVRHVTIAGDPKPLDETRELVAELRGVELEDDEDDQPSRAPWASPMGGPGGWQGGPRPMPSPYGPTGAPPVPPPGHPAWTDPTFNPYMKGVKQDDPNQVAGAIQAMAAVLGTVMPRQQEATADPSHLIATAMQAANAQTGPMMDMMVNELKAARENATKAAPAEKMQLEMMKSMNQMQTESMKQIFTMQTTMMQEQVKQQGEMMSAGMKLITKIATEVKEDKDGLLEKLPDMLEQLSAPFRGASAVPGMDAPSMPPQGAMPPGAPVQQLPPGAPPAPPEQKDEAAEYAKLQANNLVQALKFLVKAQPDPEIAWQQTMGPGIDVQQGAIRKKILELPETATADDFAQILVEAGVPVEEIHAVGTIAASVPGGMEWLGDFWALAPWLPEEEEEVDGPPPFTKEAGDGKTGPSEEPSDS